MYRRKVMVTAAAVFAIGIAFAAQPTSVHADRRRGDVQRGVPWTPGTNSLMSAHEPARLPVAPPR
jgi:hypothetical protein